MRILATLVLLGCILSMASAQEFDTIFLRNPSFEDEPHKGGSGTFPFGIRGWFDCGVINFPDETPPDIHPKDFWENTKQAGDGGTYLGMVVRDNDSWESISQLLPESLQAGSCYEMSILLSQSSRYISGSQLYNDPDPKYNYNTPAVLRIWGGFGHCETRELLAESAPVNHSPWKRYTFKLSPTQNVRSITLEAFYVVPVLVPYNGHILVDGLSSIVEINCNDEIVEVEEEVEETNLPPHKKVKQKPKATQKPTQEATASSSNNTSLGQAKTTILDLDRDKIVKGQTIEIKNLYFKADTSSINADSYEVLDELFDFLKSNEDIVIEVGGHTNGVPKHEYCDKLSTARARAVAEYLVNKGISPDKITYKGYGKRKPKASNLTAAGRKKNQRVEIKILSIDAG